MTFNLCNIWYTLLFTKHVSITIYIYQNINCEFYVKDDNALNVHCMGIVSYTYSQK